MRVAKPTQKRNWTAAAVAVVIVLAVFIAPMCASVCASKSCDVRIVSAAAETNCHHGNDHQHLPGFNAANKKACAGQELPAAALTSTRNEQARAPNLETQTTTIASEPAFSVSSANRNAFCLKWLSAPFERSKDSSPTVLRI